MSCEYLPAEEQLALLAAMLFRPAPRGMLIFRVHDRELGCWSDDYDGFRPVLFACGRAGVRPLMLPSAEYQVRWKGRHAGR